MTGQSQPCFREVIREHLLRVIAPLSAFLLACGAVVLSDAPLWSKALAAALTLLGLTLVAVWLPLSWPEWSANRGVRLVSVATPLAAAAVVIALGVTIWPPPPSPVATHPATLLLLDAADTMSEPLAGGTTKLEEAKRQLQQERRVLVAHQLGFATFGIEACDEEADQIDEVVSIAPDGAERIRDEVDDVTTSGKANLVSAARSAVGRLGQFEGYRSVVVITGGLDECRSDRDLRELFSESSSTGVAVRWQLVGLGLTADEKERVESLRPNVAVHLADTGKELDNVLEVVLFDVPLRSDVDALREFVESDVREPLNDAVDAVNRSPPDAGAARRQLEVVRSLAADGEMRFREFGTTEGACDFTLVEALLQLQFDRLQAGADALDRVVAFDEEHTGERTNEQVEERNGLIARANEPIGEYNSNLPELSNLIEDALDECFGG